MHEIQNTNNLSLQELVDSRSENELGTIAFSLTAFALGIAEALIPESQPRLIQSSLISVPVITYYLVNTWRYSSRINNLSRALSPSILDNKELFRPSQESRKRALTIAAIAVTGFVLSVYVGSNENMELRLDTNSNISDQIISK